MAGNSRSGRKLSNRPQDAKLKKSKNPTRDSVAVIFPKDISGHKVEDFPPPASMTEAAKKCWRYHLKHYIERGQSLKGCEQALEFYCGIEAVCLEKVRQGVLPSGQQMQMLLRFTIEFYDTPASHFVRAPPGSSHHPKDVPSVNPFANNGRPR